MDSAYPDRKLYYNGIASIRYPIQCVLTALKTSRKRRSTRAAELLMSSEGAGATAAAWGARGLAATGIAE